MRARPRPRRIRPTSATPKTSRFISSRERPSRRHSPPYAPSSSVAERARLPLLRGDAPVERPRVPGGRHRRHRDHGRLLRVPPRAPRRGHRAPSRQRPGLTTQSRHPPSVAPRRLARRHRAGPHTRASPTTHLFPAHDPHVQRPLRRAPSRPIRPPGTSRGPSPVARARLGSAATRRTRTRTRSDRRTRRASPPTQPAAPSVPLRRRGRASSSSPRFSARERRRRRFGFQPGRSRTRAKPRGGREPRRPSPRGPRRRGRRRRRAEESDEAEAARRALRERVAFLADTLLAVLREVDARLTSGRVADADGFGFGFGFRPTTRAIGKGACPRRRRRSRRFP